MTNEDGCGCDCCPNSANEADYREVADRMVDSLTDELVVALSKIEGELAVKAAAYLKTTDGRKMIGVVLAAFLPNAIFCPIEDRAETIMKLAEAMVKEIR